MMSDKVQESIQVALDQLHQERERIEGAIANLEGFLGNLVNSATASIAGRNEQPLRHAEATRVATKQRSRNGWTDEARHAAAQRMRQYWADRRHQAANGQPRTRKHRGRMATQSQGGAHSAPEHGTERSRKGWTPEAREAARMRMQRYWESRRQSDLASG